MFILALDPGHGINTAGKRCDKCIDPNETREWVLNSRICNYIESYLKDYTGYSLFRVDDITGKNDIALPTRVKMANDKGASFYLSVHANAGINGGSGGGIMSFSYNNSKTESPEWRDELYDALIKHTGLKGDRSDPTTTANFYVLRNTKMPAVLLELGYMDSKTDVPVILTEDFAKKCAKAIVEVIVRRGNLKKKATTTTTSTTNTNTPGATISSAPYRVQVGAYKNKANAINLQVELKKLGYSTIIKSEKDAKGVTLYKVQVGAYKNKANAIKTQVALKSLGYNSIIKV